MSVKSFFAGESTFIESRKYRIAWLCVCVGTALELLKDSGLSENMLALLLSVLGAYTGANVAAKAINLLRIKNEKTITTTTVP